MIQDIIHEEKFTHGKDVMRLYIISFQFDQNKEEFQSLMEKKQIQTIFLLEYQEKNLNLKNISNFLVDKTLDEKCNILYNEIYSAKKNIGLILTKTNNQSLCFFASFMILNEKKNEQWLNQQNFYNTLLEKEKAELKNLIKNNPQTKNDIFLETDQINPFYEQFNSEILYRDQPCEDIPINFNPPEIKSEFNLQFPQIYMESVIIDNTQQKNRSSNENTQTVEQSNQFDLNVKSEFEQTILELAPSIKFQSFYQKYSIKCFK